MESTTEEIAPPVKRVKLSSDPSGLPEIYTRIYRALGLAPKEGNFTFDLNYMYVLCSTPNSPRHSDRHRTALPKLDEASQCVAIGLVSRLSCVADGAVLDASSTADRPKYTCKYCADPENSGERQWQLNQQAKIDAAATFAKLLAHEPFLNSHRHRISAMISLRRLIRHTDTPGLYDLEASDVGQWCLQSLTSSVRELRIAAG